MKKILVVDDNAALVKVARVLTQKEYKVFEASNGPEALRLLFVEKPDLVLLDVAVPGMDGWQTLNRIRDVSDVPIILTGNRITEDDIVRGLDYGADEYLPKPIGNRELVARVRASLRRTGLSSYPDKRGGAFFRDDFLTVDVAERKVLVSGKRVQLTPKEFRLLALLVENGRNILTHQRILEKVWGSEYIDDVDYVRICIFHLRQKIEPDSSQPKYIVTEFGVGYYFNEANRGDFADTLLADTSQLSSLTIAKAS